MLSGIMCCAGGKKNTQFMLLNSWEQVCVCVCDCGGTRAWLGFREGWFRASLVSVMGANPAWFLRGREWA